MFISSFLVGVTLGTLGYCGKEIYHTIKPKKGNENCVYSGLPFISQGSFQFC